ncbi:integral membrane protein [Streptococcus pneumoniae]|uniref:YggT family protein n=1 Tax=Streptococcus pneumoniae TaxID=1313 RepID=UPI0005DB0786|nr:YggT family protein [Streptococcus pneumoniae]CGE57901.1 integral membrane protein [Streptococcus pneumoniae]CGE86552.1 integral membrane protein [Streptococcus pneumoniae]CGF44171.1 integral membrane protein [Streptococcus pneumoniae]CGG41072.1 integral membrane protein [Streptococcus pneumoniae]CGG77106.1 integral membrane protein [Streptococcus pneumoniae]
MIFLIRMIYNAVDIYSLILVAFAVMSGFPGAYESSLGRWIVALVKPVLAPLQRLPLQIAGLDLSVWVAIVLVRFLGENLVRFLAMIG